MNGILLHTDDILIVLWEPFHFAKYSSLPFTKQKTQEVCQDQHKNLGMPLLSLHFFGLCVCFIDFIDDTIQTNMSRGLCDDGGISLT